MDRRTFLADLSRWTFLCAGVPNVWRVTSMSRLQGDPFTLGVASGTNGVALPRLARRTRTSTGRTRGAGTSVAA